jgi:hypothetical protein
MRISQNNVLVHKPVSAGGGVSETIIASGEEGVCDLKAVDGFKSIVISLSSSSSEASRSSATKP